MPDMMYNGVNITKTDGECERKRYEDFVYYNHWRNDEFL